MNFSGLTYLSQKISTMTLSLQKNETKIKYKKKNDNEQKTERQRLIDSMNEQIRKQQESNQLSAIDTKLRTGKTLTASELSYLKTKNPEMYQKAVEAKQEREQYERELKSCKTKDDVQRLRVSKLVSLSAEVSSVINNPNIPDGKKLEIMIQINQRATGMLETHTKFVASAEYGSLPTDMEILEAAKENNRADDIPEAEPPREPDAAKTDETETGKAEPEAAGGEEKSPEAVKTETTQVKAEFKPVEVGGKAKSTAKAERTKTEKKGTVRRVYGRNEVPAVPVFTGTLFNKKA